jgi:hypothetical protein
MYDFWYSLGLTIIRPSILKMPQPQVQNKSINDLAAIAFVPIDSRTIKDTGLPVGGAYAFKPSRTSNAPGVLANDQGQTENVRKALAYSVKNYSSSAPAIGIYSAARFSQLISIKNFGNKKTPATFGQIIDNLHAGYVDAIGTGPESTLSTFPAFLGLMAMDALLVADFATGTPKLDQVLSEFGFDRSTPEWQIASRFALSNGFTSPVTAALQNGDGNPWNEGSPTFEQVYFWPNGHSEYAVP